MLSVVLEHFLQLLSCEEYAALYCAQRQPEPVGNLTVLEARQMHKEGYTVVARQAMYYPEYLLAVVIVLSHVVLELMWLVYVEQVVRVVHECLVTYFLAVVVDEDIPHYGVYPSLEIGIGGVFVHVAECLQRCFLQ